MTTPRGEHVKQKKRLSNAYCVALALLIAGQLGPYSATADQAQYFYDELGRLVGVSDSTGVTAVYNYDAVGNLTNIQRSTPPGSGIGIYLTAPGSGPATTQVTIQGYGFDPGARR
jgi:YD repeat-containing protein